MNMAMSQRNFFDHLHSGQVSSRSLNPFTTLGLGIASLTCLVVLFATGLVLFFYYVPDQDRAYERILHITTTLRYGRLVRDLHFITANALLVFTVLHLARVFLTGSYKGRWLNWCYGLGLFFLVLLGNFTGYLLPWDQISYWAIKVGAGLAEYFPFIGPGLKQFLLGGAEIGPETLIRSFALHAGVVPTGFWILVSLHLWRVRKDGGLAGAEEGEERVATVPWLYRAEGSVALLTLAIVVALSLLIHAPLFQRADPLHPPNPARAPWYFVGVQEMVSHSALWGGVVVPAVMGLFLLLAPRLDRSPGPGGKWFCGDRRWINTIFVLLLLSQFAFIVVGQWLRGPNWMFQLPF